MKSLTVQFWFLCAILFVSFHVSESANALAICADADCPDGSVCMSPAVCLGQPVGSPCGPAATCVFACVDPDSVCCQCLPDVPTV